MWRVLPLASLTLLVGVWHPGEARAGSLDDFTDSYRANRGSDEDDEKSSSDRESDDSSSESWDGAEESDASSTSASESSEASLDGWSSGYTRMLVGERPGRAFSFGRGPYEGRGARASADIDELADGAVADESGTLAGTRSYDPEVTGDFQRVGLSASAMTTGRFDAFGRGVSAKWSSTSLPGFAFSYFFAREFQSPATLGMGYLLYEPDVALGKRHRTSWNVGLAGIHSNDGVADLGVSFGLSGDYFPLEPMVLGARAQLHRFPGVWVGELRGSAGVMVSTRLGVEVDVRHLGIEGGEGLTTWGLSLSTYVGY